MTSYVLHEQELAPLESAASSSLNANFRADGVAIGDKLDSTTGNDTIFGTHNNDRLAGDLGNDPLYGRAGDDILLGDGPDWAAFEQGNDTLKGGDGDDRLFGNSGDDVMNGGAGTDMAVFACAFSELQLKQTAWGWIALGPDGQDRLVDIERIATDDGVFEFDCTTGSWHKIGNAPGMAFITPEARLNGTAGADVINTFVPGDKQIVRGLGGDDDIRGNGLLFGNAGNDTISVHFTRDIDGRARIYGGSGNDVLLGGDYADYLSGGTGNDTISGGNNDDTAAGGAGADLFEFYSDPKNKEFWGHDVITDFKVGIDHLSLSPSTGLTLTHLADGLMVTLDGNSSIFLKGVIDSNVTLDDLLL